VKLDLVIMIKKNTEIYLFYFNSLCAKHAVSNTKRRRIGGGPEEQPLNGIIFNFL
jgi:hypothetical protein